jgi:hypothetical protein
VYGCVRVQGYMWRAFAEFESREGDPLVARHYYARAVNAEVCTPTRALPVLQHARCLCSLSSSKLQRP